MKTEKKRVSDIPLEERIDKRAREHLTRFCEQGRFAILYADLLKKVCGGTLDIRTVPVKAWLMKLEAAGEIKTVKTVPTGKGRPGLILCILPAFKRAPRAQKE